MVGIRVLLFLAILIIRRGGGSARGILLEMLAIVDCEELPEPSSRLDAHRGCNSHHRLLESLRSPSPCYQARRHVALADAASFHGEPQEQVEAIPGWVPTESGNAAVGYSCAEKGASNAWEASD
jgi:hypothetical protein